MKRVFKISIIFFAVAVLIAAVGYIPGFAMPPLPPIEMKSEIKITRDEYNIDEVMVDISFGYSSVMHDFFASQKSATLVAEQEEKYVLKEYPDFSEEHFKLDVTKTSGCIPNTYIKYNYTETATIPREVFVADKSSFDLYVNVIEASDVDNIHGGAGKTIYYKLNEDKVILSYNADPPPVTYRANSVAYDYDKYIENNNAVITAQITVSYSVNSPELLRQSKLFVSLAVGHDNVFNSPDDIILDSFLVDHLKGYEYKGLFKNKLVYTLSLKGIVPASFFHEGSGDFYIKFIVSEYNSESGMTSPAVKYTKQDGILILG